LQLQSLLVVQQMTPTHSAMAAMGPTPSTDQWGGHPH